MRNKAYFCVGLAVILWGAMGSAKTFEYIRCFSPHYSLNYYEALFTFGKDGGSNSRGKVTFFVPNEFENEQSQHEALCFTGRGSAILECDVRVAADKAYHLKLMESFEDQTVYAQAQDWSDTKKKITMETCVGH